jgi:hypothetical protein
MEITKVKLTKQKAIQINTTTHFSNLLTQKISSIEAILRSQKLMTSKLKHKHN